MNVTKNFLFANQYEKTKAMTMLTATPEIAVMEVDMTISIKSKMLVGAYFE